MKPKLKQIQQEIISQFQLERDQATIELLLLKERFDLQKKLILLSDIIDFNPIVLPRLMPLFISIEAIDFLIKNQSEVKRRFSIAELIEYGKMYRITTRFAGQVNTLSDLRQKYNNIKPARQHTKENIY